VRALSLVPLAVLVTLSASCPGPLGGAAAGSPVAAARTTAARARATSVISVTEARLASSATPDAAPPPAPSDDADPVGTRADWGAAADDGDADDERDLPEPPFTTPSDEAKQRTAAALAANADDATPILASIARETWIFSEPSKKSRRIGYLRAGAVVPRSKERVGAAGCKGGWYRVDPRGYVCATKTASLDPRHPVALASKRRPRLDGLPYDYVLSRAPSPPLYSRVPTVAQQKTVEQDLAYHQRKFLSLSKDKDFVPLPEPGPIPEPLAFGQSLPALADGPPRNPEHLTVGWARTRSGYALLSQFESEGRRFGVTPDLFVVPLDRARWVKPSTFHGIELGGEGEGVLPVAFVMKKRATRFAPDDEGRMRAATALGFREAVPLTGRAQKGYLEARDGTWVREEDVRRIDPMGRAPTWAVEGRRWVDVSILKQSLVAYEGTKPIYVTLVSTGADGLGDPKKTHSTIQGVFLVHTKHITVTMDGDEAGDEFDLRDVPFVQYFTEGYALHGAYWHDDFGTPRSHGCVNLAPLDAAWLFSWTTPEVPAGWHAALSLKKGTLVYTHP
jgi:hypothetical protein